MNATLERPPVAEVVESTAPLVVFSITDQHIAEAKSRYEAIVSAGYPEAQVRSELTALVRARTTIDKERLRQNELARQHIVNVNGKAKDVSGRLEPMETDLQAKWDAYQAEKARAKAAAEEAKRKAIQDQIDAENAAKKAELDALEAKLAERKAALEREEAERKAKADAEAAIERERAEKARAERERVEAAEREKQRQADEAAAKAERDRLAAERAKFEAEQKAAREAQAKIDAEQAAERKRIADEAAAVKAAKDKADREEFERKARAEAEAAAKAKAEAERIAAEEARVREEERLAVIKQREAALRPDRAKLAEFASLVKHVADDHYPDVKDAEAIAVLKTASNKIDEAVEMLRNFGAA